MLGHWILLIACSIGLIGLLSQAVVNYRLKRGDSISDGMLFCCFNGYILNLFYIYCVPLPSFYRVIVPLWAGAFFILLIQRVYYVQQQRGLLLQAIAGALLMYLAIIPLILQSPCWWGMVAGWLMTAVWGIYQLPQLYAVHKRQSAHGISLMLLAAFVLQATLECTGALILELPLPSIANSLRGVVLSTMMIMQWFWYR